MQPAGRPAVRIQLTADQGHSMHCPEIGRSDTQVGRPRQRMIFAQMAGLLAMPTLLPEGVLSAGGGGCASCKQFLRDREQPVD